MVMALSAADRQENPAGMGSVHEVIEAFRDAPSNSERGTKFEQLMVR